MTETNGSSLVDLKSHTADPDEAEDVTSDVGEDSEREDDGDMGEVDADEAEALKDDLGADIREGKRRKVAGNTREQRAAVEGEQKPTASSADLWKEMQSEKETTSSSVETEEEMVRVVKTYRFAGEEVKEEKMLPASDPEAKAFLLAEAKKNGSKSAETRNGQVPPAASTTSASRPLASGGPRKRKAGGLAAMSAAVTAKPTKINTLEKSKMDWTKFKDTELGEAEKHQLDAQTKGGSSGLGSMKGYMERRNFLERVQDRLEGPSGAK